jgi:hypothetical protein
MAHSMSRSLYRWLLYLHPPAFRQLFAEEMLWIFDEAAATEITGNALFPDHILDGSFLLAKLMLANVLARPGEPKVIQCAAIVCRRVRVAAAAMGRATGIVEIDGGSSRSASVGGSIHGFLRWNPSRCRNTVCLSTDGYKAG